MTNATRMTCASLEMHGIPIMRELMVEITEIEEDAE